MKGKTIQNRPDRNPSSEYSKKKNQLQRTIDHRFSAILNDAGQRLRDEVRRLHYNE